MRALLDTDVILDLVLEREPFADDAEAIVSAHEQRQFEAYIAAITPINVFYIVRKSKGLVVAREAASLLINAFHICPIDRAVLESAGTLPLTDFEDGVQLASALAGGLDAIVTRNLADYAGATLPILSPGDFLRQLSAR